MLLKKAVMSKVNEADLGKPLMTKELGNVFTKMKNNKTPSIDGTSGEFFLSCLVQTEKIWLIGL